MAGKRRIQIKYDDFMDFVKSFERKEAWAQQTLNEFKDLADCINDKHWQGQGAEAFTREMHDVVIPGMDRFKQACDQAQQAIKQIHAAYKQAEQEAQGFFR